MPGEATLIEGWSSAVIINPPKGAVHLKVNPFKLGLPIVVIPSKLYGLSGPAASIKAGQVLTVVGA